MTRSGARAQRWMLRILSLASVAFSVVAGYFLYSFISGTGEPLTGEEVLDVYRRSALRIIPYVIAALGPLNIVMDVLGDVAFYLAKHSGLTISEAACTRLRQLLVELRDPDRSPERSIVVVAHSQGSIIAAQVLSAASLADYLVTVGSPVQSLYRHFLGHPPEPWTPQVRAWENLFRYGDYIGGPIKGANNSSAGQGGHTGYFNDSSVWRRILVKVCDNT